MKVLGSFVDCVCEPHLYKEDIGDIKTKLISRLPDKRICEMASVLIIDTKYDAYVVKIRRPEVNSRGCVDVEKTHNYYEHIRVECDSNGYYIPGGNIIFPPSWDTEERREHAVLKSRRFYTNRPSEQ